MKIKKPDVWILLVTGFCFVLSLLLSFTPAAGLMENAFYQQLLELSPALKLPADKTLAAVPSGLQTLVLTATFCLLTGYLVLRKRTGSGLFFVILVIFTLLMLQLLAAVMLQLWLPTVWTIISLSFTALLLTAQSTLRKLRKSRPLSPQQQIQAIKQKIEQGSYEIAVLMLKKCHFSDEVFDLAYDLGVKLELQENWILARYLYVWLAQYDPGIADFVTRMDLRINPERDEDYRRDEETQNSGQIGHYQLVGKKAEGATATVYEAYDLYTHKKIAMKILNQVLDGHTDERNVLSFLHEAMTVAKLDHPNIVKIHDADIVNEHAYIAMDYIEGYPMSERLRRKKLLTAAESLRIMRAVLNALVVAHQNGIVHGDIKPANVMFDQHKKRYILTDFGAANNGSPLFENEKRIVGTPAYMSPEQLSGAKVDGRSDLFSLAVTIYHLLSGMQPFGGETLSELKNNVLTRQVDMERLSVPDTIRQVLEKALQKKTYQRFADASQMLQAVNFCEQKLRGL